MKTRIKFHQMPGDIPKREKIAMMTEPATGGTCCHCKKTCRSHENYCDWECMVALARSEGGKEIRPNGLPIKSIRHDSTMLEHEHADHPDYKFPVDCEYIGPHTDRDEMETRQQHALIYCDDYVAVTVFAHCYCFWHTKASGWDHEPGLVAGGSLWKLKEWRLTTESLERIYRRSYA